MINDTPIDEYDDAKKDGIKNEIVPFEAEPQKFKDILDFPGSADMDDVSFRGLK